MPKHVRLGMIASLSLVAACAGPGPARTDATLTASDRARAAGIEAYVLEATGAALLDAAGHEIGHLTLTAPEATQRLVHIDLSGGYYDNELTRPRDGRFLVSLQADGAYEAVQLDPALASFFASFQIAFVENTATAAPSEHLQPSQYASCIHANTAANCYDLPTHPEYYCIYTPYYGANVGGFRYNVDEGTTQGDANAWCSSSCYGAGYPICDVSGDPWQGDAECYTLTSVDTNYVSCPRVSCPTSGQRDLVRRVQTCQEPGSCSNATAYYSCTTY